MSSGIPVVANVDGGEEIARSPPGPGDAFPHNQPQDSGEITF